MNQIAFFVFVLIHSITDRGTFNKEELSYTANALALKMGWVNKLKT